MLRQQTATGHDHHTCELIHADARDKIIETFADSSRGSRRQDLVQAGQFPQITPSAISGDAGIYGAIKRPAKIKLAANDFGHNAGVHLRVTIEEAQHHAVSASGTIAAQQALEPGNFGSIGPEAFTQP
jgi:hypothetical protein